MSCVMWCMNGECSSDFVARMFQPMLEQVKFIFRIYLKIYVEFNYAGIKLKWQKGLLLGFLILQLE